MSLNYMGELLDIFFMNVMISRVKKGVSISTYIRSYAKFLYKKVYYYNYLRFILEIFNKHEKNFNVSNYHKNCDNPFL